ncbi:carbohydrate porin [Methylobacterium bullatum]|nr:carbohydrate porin [Methylobacterium bullatum]
MPAREASARRRRDRRAARRPSVAGAILARPSTAVPINTAPAGSLDTLSSAPKWGLLGNLGGIRDDLFRAGIRVDASLDYQSATNIQGGLYGQSLRGAGQFALRSAIDMDRLAGIPGGTVNVVFTNRFGRSLTADQGLQVLQQTEEVFGRGRMPRLTQFSYDQRFGDFVDLKLGRLPVSADFAGFACEFQNLTFCGNQPGNLVGNYWYNWPVSQYAARLRLGNLETGYLMAGVYQVNPRDLADGFNFDPSGATGALAIVEAAVFPTLPLFAHRGSYTVGAWYQTGNNSDLYLNGSGLPLSVDGGAPMANRDRSGVYGVAVQELYRPDPANPLCNLSVFLRATIANSSTSAIDDQQTVGFVYKGFWSERPFDWIGIGIGQSHASSALAQSIHAANAMDGGIRPVPGYERAIEVFYSLALHPDVVIRPNIQLINRPGGYAGRTDIVVFGVKSGLTF